MITAVEAWERFAAKSRPRRATNAAGATTWFNWTQYPDHGPDESLLGELDGVTVLELGSGSGANLAHLTTLGARCIGVDLAPSRRADAIRTWGHLPGLEFVTADAVDFLSTTSLRFDVVYSIFGAVWFTDPTVLLPLVRASMNPGGVFAFSQLPLAEEANPEDRAIRKWNHPTDEWPRVLTAMGFRDAIADTLAPPVGQAQETLLVRASNSD